MRLISPVNIRRYESVATYIEYTIQCDMKRDSVHSLLTVPVPKCTHIHLSPTQMPYEFISFRQLPAEVSEELKVNSGRSK